MRRLLYIGCLGYANVGDEACWQASRRLLEPHLPAGWELQPRNGYDFEPTEPFDALVLGGGTLLSHHGNLGDAALREAARRDVPFAILGTGLESLDWDGPPATGAAERFLNMVSPARRIGVRGPLSRDYLVKLGLPASRVAVVGDPGVLLEASPAPRRKAKHVAVNVGTSFGRVYGWDEQAMIESLIEFLGRVARDGWRICLFPIWPRDREVQQQVADRLAEWNPRVVHEVLEAEPMIEFLGEFPRVVAMKLHVGIFATVAGTPYLPWAYRPKVEDFAASLGVQDYCVRTDAGPDRLSLAWNKLERDEQWFRERQRTGVERMRRQLREFARQVARDLTSKVVPAGSPTHRSSEDPVH